MERVGGRDVMFEQLEYDRTKQSPPQASGATDHEHDKRFRRSFETHAVETDHARIARHAGAANSRYRTGKAVHNHQPRIDLRADHPRPQTVVLYRTTEQTERRSDQPAQDDENDRQHGDRESISRAAIHIEGKDTEHGARLDSGK